MACVVSLASFSRPALRRLELGEWKCSRLSGPQDAEDLDRWASPARVGDDRDALERRRMSHTELQVLPDRLLLVLVELGAEDVDETNLPVLADGRVDRRYQDVPVVLLLHVIDRLESEDGRPACHRVSGSRDHSPSAQQR